MMIKVNEVVNHPLTLPLLTATRLRVKRRRGVTIVETGAVIITVLLLIMGLFEFSRWLMVMNICSNAARQGARVAVVSTDSKTTTQIVDYVHSLMPAAARPFEGYNKNTNIQIYRSDRNGVKIGAASDPNTWQNAGADDYIVVRVTGKYQPLVPLGFAGISYINIQSTSIMSSEAN